MNGLCACGCGEPVSGINPNTKQPIRFRRGHWARGNLRALQTAELVAARTAKRQATLAERLPSEETVIAALSEHGSRSATARALRIAPTTLRKLIERYGIDHTMHANSLPRSDLQFGLSAEEHVAYLVDGDLHRPVSFRDAPYDVVAGGLRVNVKAARPSIAGKPPTSGWTFHVGRGRGKCDVFLCVACAPDGMPVRYFLVPDADAPEHSVRVPTTLRGKWMQYLWRPGQQLL